MNKADLIDQVASETGSTKVDAAKALDAVVDAVTGALAKGDSVSLVGFGTFSVRHRALCLTEKVPNPTSETESPLASAPVTASTTASNALAASTLVLPVSLAT